MAQVELIVRRNGSTLVVGDVVLKDQDGNVIVPPKLPFALCRCGRRGPSRSATALIRGSTSTIIHPLSLHRAVDRAEPVFKRPSSSQRRNVGPVIFLSECQGKAHNHLECLRYHRTADLM